MFCLLLLCLDPDILQPCDLRSRNSEQETKQTWLFQSRSVLEKLLLIQPSFDHQFPITSQEPCHVTLVKNLLPLHFHFHSQPEWFLELISFSQTHAPSHSTKDTAVSKFPWGFASPFHLLGHWPKGSVKMGWMAKNKWGLDLASWNLRTVQGDGLSQGRASCGSPPEPPSDSDLTALLVRQAQWASEGP